MFKEFLGKTAAMVAMAISLSVASPAIAAWPDKPIKVIVPFAAGGGTDIYVRFIADVLSRRLGQPFFIQNVPGANGALAVRAVRNAKPDGYTILGTSNSPVVVNPSLQPQSAIDPLKELTPVGMFVATPLVLVASPSLGVKTLNELLAAAREKPDRITYSSAGIGNASHLVAELLAQTANVKFMHVPYNSASQASLAVLTGDVHFTLYGPQSVSEYVKKGQLIALAIAEPVAVMPGVPTFAKEGYAGTDAAPWGGLFFPPDMPKDIVEKLDAELAAALRDPQVIAGMEAQGFLVRSMRTSEFREKIASDLVRWKKVITEAGISAK